MTVAARTAFLAQAYRFPGPREYVGAQLLGGTNALPPLPHSRPPGRLNAEERPPPSGRPLLGADSRRGYLL